MPDATASPRLYAAYLAAATVWGASFLFIAVALEGLAPLQVAFGRLVLGSVALVLILVVRRVALPRDLTAWWRLAVMGLFFCAIPFSLFAWAQTSVPSGLASVYNATTPLWTLVLVLAFARMESVSPARILGIAVGFAGVCLVFAPALADRGDAPVAAHLACLGATASYGVALVWLRRYVLPLGLSTEVIATGQVLTGTVWAGVVVLLFGRTPVDVTWPVVGAMVALGVLGTGLAYVWHTAVSQGLGVTTASTVTYLTPVVGVALGVLILGEHVTWYEIAGGAVIILGVAVGQGVLQPRRRRGPASGTRDVASTGAPTTM